jgi:hypothetical protein
MNGTGWVVWAGLRGFDTEIFCYNGTSTTQLTNNTLPEMVPQVNNSGWVVWEMDDGSDTEVFVHDGVSSTQITDNAHDDKVPQINNSGWIVWEANDGSDDEIFIAAPDGSCIDDDGDGYGDPSDASCSQGPETDCDNAWPFTYPGAPERCDGRDNQCPGDPGYGEVDEGGVCETSCAASAAASSYDASPVYGASELGKLLARIGVPLGAVIGLMLRRRKR